MTGHRRTSIDTLAHAEKHIGHGVTYKPQGNIREHGVLRGVNTHWVFVQYGGDLIPKATAPRDLELMNGCEHTADIDGNEDGGTGTNETGAGR